MQDLSLWEKKKQNNSDTGSAKIECKSLQARHFLTLLVHKVASLFYHDMQSERRNIWGFLQPAFIPLSVSF